MATYTEEISVAGGKLKSTLKSILREGNVRRVVIQNSSGRTLLDVPLAAGIVGAALLPFWAAIGGIAALAADFKILVVRDVVGPPAPMPNDARRQ
ncbi:protein of unknown function DUF4342 [Gemmatirosa kalamazoonensis]|uniref:DUF4342 domain-containing protein n=1 Tax=Gemmatirosa kalamazoonensis TaxID=861299 RepID=W0REI5_9BACT|nr:DUF4342 domain-containing protein [Gemmatirosa kalamazoonensis]AHG87788.1 protein of unknown function DUF4342 [Gemmatirosa kalamazoonensis]